MRMLRALILVAGLGLVPKPSAPVSGPVQFPASDGVTVYADSYPGPAPKAPVILLFHQADSSRSEYAPLAPRLVLLGYNALAIDQRSGGDLYPPPNETVQHLGRSAEFLDVLHDMDGALAWAKRTYPGAPIYACGSSYSASLVFVLAARHPKDIAAVIAFSPGEYFDDKHLIEAAAGKIRVPVFIDSAPDSGEEHAAKLIFDALRVKQKEHVVPRDGVHGASTLRADRDPAGAAANWQSLTSFLAKLPAAPH